MLLLQSAVLALVQLLLTSTLAPVLLLGTAARAHVLLPICQPCCPGSCSWRQLAVFCTRRRRIEEGRTPPLPRCTP